MVHDLPSGLQADPAANVIATIMCSRRSTRPHCGPSRGNRRRHRPARGAAEHIAAPGRHIRAHIRSERRTDSGVSGKSVDHGT
jgi:hypothetical protein